MSLSSDLNLPASGSFTKAKLDEVKMLNAQPADREVSDFKSNLVSSTSPYPHALSLSKKEYNRVYCAHFVWHCIHTGGRGNMKKLPLPSPDLPAPVPKGTWQVCAAFNTTSLWIYWSFLYLDTLSYMAQKRVSASWHCIVDNRPVGPCPIMPVLMRNSPLLTQLEPQWNHFAKLALSMTPSRLFTNKALP